MKKTALILAFLVCFINYQGFAGGKPQKDENIATKDDVRKINEELSKINEELKKRGTAPTLGGGSGGNPSNQGTSDRLPVNRKIVQFLLKDEKNSNGLKFYLSEAIIVKIFETKEIAEIQNINNKIVLSNPQSPDTPKSTTEFSKDSEGIINGFGPANDKGRQIKIRFPDKENRTLIFTRNTQKDNYELTEIEVLDDKTRRVDSLVTIQLMVSGTNDRKTELKVIPAEYAYMNNQQPDNVSNNNRNTVNDNYSYNANFNRAVNSSRTVMGKGSTSPERVIAYVRKINRDLSNSDIVIINEYFYEARYEGVNVDLAIAQMLHWTGFFRRRDRMATCNYGGLKDCSFPNIKTGVRAHIQHLKAYARQRPKREIIVDPRFNFVFDHRGFPGIAFDQVYPIWSQNPRYRQDIEEILRNL
jgi:hypothetical protein